MGLVENYITGDDGPPLNTKFRRTTGGQSTDTEGLRAFQEKRAPRFAGQ
jgi:hypothetical protein